MSLVGDVHRLRGRWNEAESLQVQGLKTSKSKLEANHPDTLTSTANLAITLQSQGSISKAISLIENCCELQTEVSDPGHPHTVSSRQTLTE